MSVWHHSGILFDQMQGIFGVRRNPFTEKMRIFVNTGQTDAEAFQKLIDEGGDVKTPEPITGYTLLHIAASRNFPDTIRMLLNFKECACFKSEESNYTVVRYTADKGLVECLRALVDGGMRFDDGGMSGMAPIHAACVGGHLDCVVLLLDAGVDVNRKAQQGGTPFTHAVDSGSIPLVKLLIERGAKHDNDNSLHLAASNGDMDMIQFLLDLGHGINDSQWCLGSYNTPLWIAVRNNKHDIASFLIDNGADVNGVGSGGRTCLTEACYRGYTDIIHLLLRKGADTELMGEDEAYGKSALYHALEYDPHDDAYTPNIDALLAFGANVDNYMHRHLSPLYTAFARDPESAKKLIILGANVHTITSNIKKYPSPDEAEFVFQRPEVTEILASIPFPLLTCCMVKDDLQQLRLKIMANDKKRIERPSE